MVCIRPSCTSLPSLCPGSKSGNAVLWYTTVQAADCRFTPGALAPAELCCLGHPRLIGPMRPTRRHISISPFRLIRNALAVRPIASPRRPTSGSALSLHRSFSACRPLRPRGGCRCIYPVPLRQALAFTESSQQLGPPDGTGFRGLRVRLCCNLLSCSPPPRRLLHPGLQRFGHPPRHRV